MKKLNMIKYLLIGMITLPSLVLTGQTQFEGIIKFQKTKGEEVTKYTYFIKGNNVRIDEFGPDGTTIKGIMLIDNEKSVVTALSPDRKLYMDASNNKPGTKVMPKVTKTSNKKKIKGYDCTEWVVSSDAEETTISYWVIDESKFSFFEPLLKTLNRKDRLSKYWLEVPGIKNKFTMVGTEKAKDGSKRTELEVIEMEEKKVEQSVFDIPKDYVKFEK